MMKSEMSPEALADRQMFVQLLSEAGWEVESWEDPMAGGANVEPEAEAEYHGETFDLRLEYHASDRSLVFQLAARSSDVALSLKLFPKDLSLVVGHITPMPESLSDANYTDFVKSLIPLCFLVLVETEDGLYRLSIDPINDDSELPVQ